MALNGSAKYVTVFRCMLVNLLTLPAQRNHSQHLGHPEIRNEFPEYLDHMQILTCGVNFPHADILDPPDGTFRDP